MPRVGGSTYDMTRSRSLIAAIACALALALPMGCGGDSTPTAVDTLQLSQKAALEAGNYRIEFTGHNLVLPQWGGVDSGEVLVDPTAPTVSADVERTGDGMYEVLFIDGETVFKRSTCDHFQRVPGGGAGVLKAFIWSDAGILGSLSDPQYAVGAGTERTVILAEVESLGPVQIDLDRETKLPIRLVKTGDPGSESEWQFSDWGKTLTTAKPEGPLEDRGPGGNPC